MSSWGRLSTCAAVGYRRCPVPARGIPSGSGRLTIGRSLPNCPTTESHPPFPPKPLSTHARARCLADEERARAQKPLTAPGAGRSEEHTSELQSLRHLVCRLLLEK